MVNSRNWNFLAQNFMPSFEVFDIHFQTAHKKKVSVKKILGYKLVKPCWRQFGNIGLEK